MHNLIIIIVLISSLISDTSYASQSDSLEGVISWRHSSDNQNNTKSLQAQAFGAPLSVSSERSDGFNYLNALRNGAGLISYGANSKLDDAAQNHINYLITNNEFGHGETSGLPGFTGASPSARLTYTNYSWTSIGENISAGSDTTNEAIDGLFSAIYHRFGFLDFNNNEVGIGLSYDDSYAYGSAHGFDMANSGNVLTTRQLNPKYVLWPYQNYNNAQTSFNNSESPDPTPECPNGGITGNPISIGFNPDKNGTIGMSTFKLFKNDGTEITNTKILSSGLSDTQFVLFPMTSLSLDSRYRANFSYTEVAVEKNISWYFNTRRYTDKRYEVSHSNTYNVISGQSYIIHLKPFDCTTTLNSYSWNSGAVVERLSPDVFRISVTSDTTFTFNSGSFVFTLHIAQSDNAIDPSSQDIPSLTPIISYLLF